MMFPEVELDWWTKKKSKWCKSSANDANMDCMHGV